MPWWRSRDPKVKRARTQHAYTLLQRSICTRVAVQVTFPKIKSTSGRLGVHKRTLQRVLNNIQGVPG
jgi:ActR/RegA family two-component response regulator